MKLSIITAWDHHDSRRTSLDEVRAEPGTVTAYGRVAGEDDVYLYVEQSSNGFGSDRECDYFAIVKAAIKTRIDIDVPDEEINALREKMGLS